MSQSVEFQSNACIVEGVRPLLNDLQHNIGMQHCTTSDTGRPALEQFIRHVFRQTYGAELNSFYPNLVAFTQGGQLRGGFGYRDGMTKPLFSEQYLDAPTEHVLADRFQRTFERHHLVEVGNLALGVCRTYRESTDRQSPTGRIPDLFSKIMSVFSSRIFEKEILYPLFHPFRACILFKFHPMQTNVHSLWTESKPRSRNCLNPWTCLMMPKTVSTVDFRFA